MKEKIPIPFTLKILENKYVLGIFMDNWYFFYKQFYTNPKEIVKVDFQGLELLFVNYLQDQKLKETIVKINADLILNLPIDQTQTETYFNKKTFTFITKEENNERNSTYKESLSYVDILQSQYQNLDAIRLRILELSYDIVPDFQYRIEHKYRKLFEPLKKKFSEVDENFTTKIRKKTFDKIYKEKILPLAKKEGFERRTKTSKALVKKLVDGLSQVILFNYISFGNGGYEVAVYFYDDDKMGDFMYDEHIAKVHLFPYHTNVIIHSYNEKILSFETDYLLRNMELYLFSFLKRNSTHQDLIHSLNNEKMYLEDFNTLKKEKNKFINTVFSLTIKDKHKAFLLNKINNLL